MAFVEVATHHEVKFCLKRHSAPASLFSLSRMDLFANTKCGSSGQHASQNKLKDLLSRRFGVLDSVNDGVAQGNSADASPGLEDTSPDLVCFDNGSGAGGGGGLGGRRDDL